MKKPFVLVCTALLAAAAMAQTNLALPAGTALNVKLETTLATFTSKSGDTFSGRVTQPVVMDGKTIVPVGTTVQGRVSRVKEPPALRESQPSVLFRKVLFCRMASVTH